MAASDSARPLVIVGVGRDGNDRGLVPLVGARGKGILQGVHVRRHLGNTPELDGEEDRDTDGNNVESACTDESVLDGGEEVLKHRLVGKKGTPCTAILADRINAKCINQTSGNVDNNDAEMVGSRRRWGPSTGRLPVVVNAIRCVNDGDAKLHENWG